MLSVLKAADRMNENLSFFCMKIGALILILVTIGTLIQVVLRYFFGAGIGWIDEISSYSLLWISFLAAPYLTIKRQHVSVDMLPKMVKRKFPRSNVVYDLLINGLIIYGSYWSMLGLYDFVLSNLTVYAAMLPFKMVYVYAIAPVSVAIIIEIVVVQSLITVAESRTQIVSKAHA